MARLAGANEYRAYEAQRAAYWAYWNAPSGWKTDSADGFDMYFSHFGGETGVIFPTDHNQMVIGSWPERARAASWRADPERSLHAVLGFEPVIGPLIRDSRPDGMVRGTLNERFFFRTGVGSGWALVGDAGHHKDFVIGDGITEALLQARSLATAIAAGNGAALTCWWRARDVAALPWFFLGKAAGVAGPLPELSRLLLSRMHTDPALKARLLEVIDRRVSPFDIIPGFHMAWWTLAAAIRGRPRAVGEFVAAGGQAATIYREVRTRRRLLEEAQRK